MTTLTIEMPEEAFSALRHSPSEFGNQMRIAAATYWYQKGEISQEKAAQIAGMSRTEFLRHLAREEVEVFQVDFEDLQRELMRV
jgi:predicted HTH domain antitoxin